MKGLRFNSVDKSLSVMRTDISLIAQTLDKVLDVLETLIKQRMNNLEDLNYDGTLPRTYGKEVDLDDIGDCPKCLGKCELAGGLISCECTYCGTDAPELRSFIAE